MPAPSVAVKIPPTIPPMTITIRSRLGMASRVILTASEAETFWHTG
jgi:hypothetical protein